MNKTLLTVLILYFNLSVLQARTDEHFKSQIQSTTSKSISIIPDSKTEEDTFQKGTPDTGNFKHYLTDHCELKFNHIENEDDLRSDGLRRCNDGTVSFVQPESEGLSGAEGKCGQTAAANIMYMYCKLITSPKYYTDRYLSDITPGVRPATLRDGLNDMFDTNWKKCPQEKGTWRWYDSYDNEAEYINAIKNGVTPFYSSAELITRKIDGKEVLRSPVALLIRNPGGQLLHWITVVDVIEKQQENVNKCLMVINHWDDQYEVPCSVIAKWSRGVQNSYGLFLNKYSIVKFKK